MKVTLSVEQNDPKNNALRVTVYEASSYGNEEAVETLHIREETSFELSERHSIYIKPYTIG